MSDVSIIQQFLHPPIGLCTLEVISGAPFSDVVAVDRPRGLVRTDAFGIRYLVTFSPPGYGISDGAGSNHFDRPVVEIATRHQLLDGEIIVTSQQAYDTASGTVMFEESFPYIVNLLFSPGIEASLWWVLVL